LNIPTKKGRLIDVDELHTDDQEISFQCVLPISVDSSPEIGGQKKTREYEINELGI
jgi:hypothetical protein